MYLTVSIEPSYMDRWVCLNMYIYIYIYNILYIYCIYYINCIYYIYYIYNIYIYIYYMYYIYQYIHIYILYVWVYICICRVIPCQLNKLSSQSDYLRFCENFAIVCIGVSTPPQKHHSPLSCQAPLKSASCPSPHFLCNPLTASILVFCEPP